MAGKAAKALAGAIAPQTAADNRAETETVRVEAYMRGLFMTCLVALFAAPALLAVPFGIAVALPAGLTVAACVLLLGLTLALLRFGTRTETAASEPVSDPYAICPGLVLHLDPHGAVLSMSGRDTRTFSAYLSEPVGRSLVEQLHVSDRLALASALDSLRAGEITGDVECRLERRVNHAQASRYLYVRISLSPVIGDDGAVSGIFCQLRDIAAEIALRDAALHAEQDAESANEAKSRFLAAVSHELRTPLNAILGFSDILIGEYFGKLENDRQREYVRLIRESGGHLLAVVNTMLDMSKIEAGRYELLMEHFCVADVMQSCEAMLSLQAKDKGVTLTARVHRELGEVVADQRAIQQILINLVGNAIKFTEAGGVVSMDAVAEAGRLKLTIGDTGIGIAPEKLALIGQPFMQVQNDLSRQYEGTGLGLSLVKGLVALHGGAFAIESHPGEGTVITVTVPLDGSGAAAVEADGEERMVEFPPRLKSGHAPAVTPRDDVKYEDAKAKIA